MNPHALMDNEVRRLRVLHNQFEHIIVILQAGCSKLGLTARVIQFK